MICSAVHKQLLNRMCETYAIYFATKKDSVSHVRFLKHKIKSIKVRQLKVGKMEAQRNKEVICILLDEKTGFEWIEQKHLKYEEIVNAVDNTLQSTKGFLRKIYYILYIIKKYFSCACLSFSSKILV